MNDTCQSFRSENVSASVLAPLLSGNHWRWLYGERREATELCWLADALAAAVPWQRWRHARLFNNNSELAWWQTGNDSYRLRLLATDAPPRAEGITWYPGTTWQAVGNPVATLLHGERDDQPHAEGRTSWSEARIPRWLFYPVPPTTATRVALLVQPLARNGIIGLHRLMRLEAV